MIGNVLIGIFVNRSARRFHMSLVMCLFCMSMMTLDAHADDAKSKALERARAIFHLTQNPLPTLSTPTTRLKKIEAFLSHYEFQKKVKEVYEHSSRKLFITQGFIEKFEAQEETIRSKLLQTFSERGTHSAMESIKQDHEFIRDLSEGLKLNLSLGSMESWFQASESPKSQAVIPRRHRYGLVAKEITLLPTKDGQSQPHVSYTIAKLDEDQGLSQVSLDSTHSKPQGIRFDFAATLRPETQNGLPGARFELLQKQGFYRYSIPLKGAQAISQSEHFFTMDAGTWRQLVQVRGGRFREKETRLNNITDTNQPLQYDIGISHQYHNEWFSEFHYRYRLMDYKLRSVIRPHEGNSYHLEILHNI